MEGTTEDRTSAYPSVHEPKKIGRYGNISITIHPDNETAYPEDPEQLERLFLSCISQWEADVTITAVWCKVHTQSGRFIPVLSKVGFKLHRVDHEDDHIIFTRWLVPGSLNKVPQHGTHIAGACGMVVRRGAGGQRLALVVRERVRQHHWEFPGGAIDKGEYVVEAACREVMEEVGLKVYPVGFAGVWDELQSRFGCNSLYFCIVMSLTPPKNSCNSQNEHDEEAEEEPALALDPAEIVEARWVPLEEIVGKEEDEEVDEEGKKRSTSSQVGGYPFSTPLRHFVAGYLSTGTRESGRLLDNTSHTYGAMSGKGYFFLPS